MPRLLYLPLRVLAGLGAMIAFIVGLYTLIAWHARTGAGVPGFQDTFKRLLLYATILTSGVESLLLSGLGYWRVIRRQWSIVGVGLFGTMFLVSLTTLVLFFGAYLKSDFRLGG